MTFDYEDDPEERDVDASLSEDEALLRAMLGVKPAVEDTDDDDNVESDEDEPDND